MKPAPFDYARPASLAEAFDLLGRDDAKVLAGGQSLGPMLNLRLVQPALLVDITRLPETTRVEETVDGVLFGACTTHAAIEDGRVPDPTGGALWYHADYVSPSWRQAFDEGPQIGRHIFYRRPRTNGFWPDFGLFGNEKS